MRINVIPIALYIIHKILAMGVEQLPLDLSFREGITFGNFCAAGNQEVLYSLKSYLQNTSDQPIYLWGDSGSGKSHLLYAACHFLTKVDLTVAFVPLNEYEKLSIELFEGLDNLDLVCIDDVEAIAKVSEWEQALFHFYNRVKQSKTRLILSSHSVPQSCGLQLNDLMSRLSWGLVLQVNELNDSDKILAMQLRAKQRGIELPVQVGEYLLRRQPRNTKSLFKLLDSLDRASLAAQRKLTIPFVKEILADGS